MSVYLFFQSKRKEKQLRRIPLKVRAISAKNYLLKVYSQYINVLKTI